ncbi:hypothetical protein [Mesorhizobium sp. CO1-1-9]|uniref:hypothetical protein n=1 Tax=Mesorhizobium sp. CO1-1-9 TaxID=2876630 RepID=UPI001CCB144D|nr:hypothetical protein [Mesorhizobium sp. CO1-1-9]MBZ9695499.1 hypothetical protein [Mesorhizobium sp. CO1-1-9]
MSEKPEKWWAPSSPEEAAAIAQRQQDFKAQFGSFAAVAADGFWLGCSPDGQHLAFQFEFDRPDGTVSTQRISLVWQDVNAFFTNLAVAIDDMGQRQLAHVETGGSA